MSPLTAAARRLTIRLGRWAARYLPSEVVGAAAAVATATAFAAAGHAAVAAAVAATVAEVIGFYGVMALRLWRRQRRQRDADGRPDRAGRAAARVARQLLAEFGLAEVADSVLIRPAAMLAGPLLTGATAGGTLLGKLLADLVFYTVVILSYERLRRAGGEGSPVAGVAGPPPEVPHAQ
ncbi:hypothetical protein [Dactylosporangium matsuzakiense]|uniref:Uncharacterized protein n=1 Tax=Dactylosporangium matsuzakiense TaxID=53360 RepID=A0A9W6KC01_9ACTN|nr:hypothetical protein [Dactylosporangium matsuzakiense]UWZ45293.1 hypothetical protein Dmats_01700 [Dactylosporangium matsuzakiense]GLK98732.1 hypothetical protein GCM10017581_004730 [Dactylosporangium matsuzakiense]